MEGFALKYYRFTVWVVRLVYVNLLWILFTVIGLGVLGIMPATAAMFAVVRKWLRGEDDFPIFTTYKDAYKEEFLKANLLGYILAIIGYILYLDIQIMQLQEGLFFQFFTYLVIVIFVFYFITLIYAFPMFAHMDLKIRDYLRWSLILGVTHPIITIFILIGLGIIYLFTIRLMPILFILLGLPLVAFVVSWGAKKIFDKLEATADELEKEESKET